MYNCEGGSRLWILLVGVILSYCDAIWSVISWEWRSQETESQLAVLCTVSYFLSNKHTLCVNSCRYQFVPRTLFIWHVLVHEERQIESWMYTVRAQYITQEHSDLGQCSNPDCSIQMHLSLGYPAALNMPYMY